MTVISGKLRPGADKKERLAEIANAIGSEEPVSGEMADLANALSEGNVTEVVIEKGGTEERGRKR